MSLNWMIVNGDQIMLTTHLMMVITMIMTMMATTMMTTTVTMMKMSIATG